MSKRVERYIISGRVQMVGFRFFAQRLAQQYAVTGYVRNLSGGAVEVVARGLPEPLKQFRNQLQQGPVTAEVTGFTRETFQGDTSQLTSFTIRW